MKACLCTRGKDINTQLQVENSFFPRFGRSRGSEKLTSVAKHNNFQKNKPIGDTVGVKDSEATMLVCDKSRNNVCVQTTEVAIANKEHINGHNETTVGVQRTNVLHTDLWTLRADNDCVNVVPLNLSEADPRNDDKTNQRTKRTFSHKKLQTVTILSEILRNKKHSTSHCRPKWFILQPFVLFQKVNVGIYCCRWLLNGFNFVIGKTSSCKLVLKFRKAQMGNLFVVTCSWSFRNFSLSNYSQLVNYYLGCSRTNFFRNQLHLVSLNTEPFFL